MRGVDILPLRPGHTLVIPKNHISRLSDLTPELAAAVGRAVSRVARALTEGKLLSCGVKLLIVVKSDWKYGTQCRVQSGICSSSPTCESTHISLND